MGADAHLPLRGDHQLVRAGFFRPRPASSLSPCVLAERTTTDGFPEKARRLGRQFGLLGNGINGGRAHDGGRQQDRHAKATLKKLKAIHDNAR